MLAKVLPAPHFFGALISAICFNLQFPVVLTQGASLSSAIIAWTLEICIRLRNLYATPDGRFDALQRYLGLKHPLIFTAHLSFLHRPFYKNIPHREYPAKAFLGIKASSL